MKEAQALFNALESLLFNTYNASVDAFVDNKVLLHSWERHVSFTVARNLSLNLIYVFSRKNIADTPYQSLSDRNCSLSLSAWYQLDSPFALTLSI